MILKNKAKFKYSIEQSILKNLKLFKKSTSVDLVEEVSEKIKTMKINNDPTKFLTREVLEIFQEISTGRAKIVLSSFLNIKLNPNEFEKTEIEECFEYSVDVFSKEYFLNNQFNKSCLLLLRRYPELIHSKVFIRKYTKTKKSEIIEFIKDPTELREMMLQMNDDETREIHSKYISLQISHNNTANENKSSQMINKETNNNSIRKGIFHWAILYNLRDNIEINYFDFDVLFEFFFNEEFLIYLLIEIEVIDSTILLIN